MMILMAPFQLEILCEKGDGGCELKPLLTGTSSSRCSVGAGSLCGAVLPGSAWLELSAAGSHQPSATATPASGMAEENPQLAAGVCVCPCR